MLSLLSLQSIFAVCTIRLGQCSMKILNFLHWLSLAHKSTSALPCAFVHSSFYFAYYENS